MNRQKNRKIKRKNEKESKHILFPQKDTFNRNKKRAFNRLLGIKKSKSKNLEEWCKTVKINNLSLRFHQIGALLAIVRNCIGQIIIPTAGGKTLIESAAIIFSLLKEVIGKDDVFNAWKTIQNGEIPVYTVLTPRILLGRQMYDVMDNHTNNMNVHFLVVDSGNFEQKINKDRPFGELHRKIMCTTNSQEIREEYEKCKKDNISLIIISTYDSASQIMNAKIPIYMLLCDEAHHLVSNEFLWIPKEFNAQRKYYFTATRKTEVSNNGKGMNNSLIFGNIIYEVSPLELYLKGEIIRPRIHRVITRDKDNRITERDELACAIADSFTKHQQQLDNHTEELNWEFLEISKFRLGAKLLICTKNSEHLHRLVSHTKIRQLLQLNPGLQIFDTSSAHGNRINGIEVSRQEFLKRLKELKDEDMAIIFHIRILREGLDMPNITGIMMTSWGSLINFLQNLGRATRLHPIDRKNLYSEKVKPNNVNKLIKPYAWIIIPSYNEEGENLNEMIENILNELTRNWYFRADEDVIISSEPPVSSEKGDKPLNSPDRRGDPSFLDYYIEFHHTIQNIISIENYDTAKNLIKNKITSRVQYEILASNNGLPDNFPMQPHLYYGKDWVSWEDFLSIKIDDEKMYNFIISNKLYDALRLYEYKKNNILPINFPTDVDTFIYMYNKR